MEDNSQGGMEIEEIEGAVSLNKVLREYDSFVKEWKTISDPIIKSRDEAMTMCGIILDKKANVKHIVVGALLSYMVTGATFEKMKEQVKFMKEQPFIEVSPDMDQKYKDIINKVKELANNYYTSKDRISGIS